MIGEDSGSIATDDPLAFFSDADDLGLGVALRHRVPEDSQKCLATSGTGGSRRMKEYTVIYEHGPDNWSAYVPDLPGCIATGKNRNDVETQIREAMQFHIEGLRQHGEPVPEPTIEAGKVVLTT